MTRTKRSSEPKVFWTAETVTRAVREAIMEKNFQRAVSIIQRAEAEYQMANRQFDFDEKEEVPLAAVPGIDERTLGVLHGQNVMWLSQLEEWTESDYRKLPNVGAKTAKMVDRSVVSFRRKLFAAEIGECMLCAIFGRSGPAEDVHEIARGSGIRRKAVRDRRAWLVLCRACHDEMGNYRLWPPERQLAVKRIADPEYYSLEFFNGIRTGSRQVTADEVAMAVRSIDAERRKR